MPSGNAVRLITNQTTTVNSATQRLQAYREEVVTFWIHLTVLSGSQVAIRGAPDDAAFALGGGIGALMHLVISTGTAGTNQTKVNADGHAIVVLQALPLMMVRFSQGISGDVGNVWMIE